MRYKKRYILAYVDSASLHGYHYKTAIKMIRDAYAERFGRDELEHARISLVYSNNRYGKGRDGREEGKHIIHATPEADWDVEYAHGVGRRNLYAQGKRMLLPIIVRCSLEHYAHLMHILSTLGIRTVTTSGTLKALRKRQGLLVARSNIDGDEVRAAPG